ncbi:MAG TPA: hypothetical protein VFQ40_05005 [Actinomycetota bacterium]|nr:hypothetical protein [Actinomycetota bacterium]
MTAEEAATLRGWTSAAGDERARDRQERVRGVAAERDDSRISQRSDAPDGVLVLIATLCERLRAEGVRYCHWKSNEAIARSLTGENDLDLLVARSDARAFEGVLRQLGFREVRQPAWKRLPGIYHAYGVDPSGAFVHIHAHHQLVVGDDMTKNVHLPIEEAYLASSGSSGTFPIPSPAFELAVFLIRMVVKHCTWDAILSLQGSLSASERRELHDLRDHAALEDVLAVGTRHLPFVPDELWERCLRSVERASPWFRIRTASRLQRTLGGCSRRAPAADTWLRMLRRARTVVRRKVLRRGPVQNQLASGGALVAIVGGDGAGKSTVVDGLARWFGSEHIETHAVHLGKPPWSLLTSAVKGIMKVAAAANRTSTPSGRALRSALSGTAPARITLRHRARLAWEVLTARDRYRAYRRARRLATNGAIVISDRFPLPEISSMDGAVMRRASDLARWGRWGRAMARLERAYYDRIGRPDVLVVLTVEPDTAVERKRGIEPESTVRPRSEEIRAIDWSGRAAVVIDTSASRDEVLTRAKLAVWSGL